MVLQELLDAISPAKKLYQKDKEKLEQALDFQERMEEMLKEFRPYFIRK